MWLVDFVLIAVVIASSVCALRALEPRLLFHPVRAEKEWQNFGCDFEELTLPDQTSALWCPVLDAKSVVLYCHGNFGNISMREEWVRALQHHLGASVMLFDYPGFGKTPGKPDENGCYCSAESAFVWLRTQGFAPQEIVLWGKALGAAIATEMAVRHPDSRAIVLLDAFSSLSDAARVYLRVPLGFLARNRFDNAHKIGGVALPKLIIGGEEDRICPAWMTRKLGEQSRESKCVRILRGRAHAEMLPESKWKILADELRRFSGETA